MRTIFLLRGTPASGKSTWVKENGLEPYTLSADGIRLLYQSPILQKDGTLAISQNNDGEVWDLLLQLLEKRMNNGEFVIVDATHYKSELLNRYKPLIEKYRYRAFVVDFTGIPIEELLLRNKNRDQYKFVPEEVIHKMYEVFKSDTEVSKRFNIITPDEAVAKINEQPIFDYNQYDKIVMIGDIHGCYQPLKQYFDENPFDRNVGYIFTGDYIDRGIQNKEVLEFLLSIYTYKNVLLLEGNHEKWLRQYANDEYMSKIEPQELDIIKKYYTKKEVKRLLDTRKVSSDFINDTRPQLEDLSKKDLRQLCRTFGQIAHITFGSRNYFVSHGAIPCLPHIFYSTKEIVRGVGKYEDLDEIYNSWHKNTDGNTVMVHGHRNLTNYPIDAQPNIYNLCDTVEFGGNLRVLEVYKDGNTKCLYYKNDVYNKDIIQESKKPMNMLDKLSNEDIVAQLDKSKLVQRKDFDNNIVSYNFTRRAFTDRKWNDVTTKARGLFIDYSTKNVIMRSYDKFYNWGEQQVTKSESLAKNLVFPVKAYRKENGFLGMVSYNPYTDDLLIGSKSSLSSDFAYMIKDNLYNQVKDIKGLKQFVKENNCTMVFEVIDPIKDPHIIEYGYPEIILLDIVYNEYKYKKMEYEEVCKVARRFDLDVKQLEYTFESWQELYDFKHKQDVSYEVTHEGWVFEDSTGFMLKYKTRFYQFWKYMRGIKDKLGKNQSVKKTFRTKEEVMAYNIMKDIEPEILQTKSIIDIENIFYKNYEG